MLLKDKIWLFGFDPETIDEFLGEYGWRVVEHLGYDELGERYVKPTGRELESHGHRTDRTRGKVVSD